MSLITRIASPFLAAIFQQSGQQGNLDAGPAIEKTRQYTATIETSLGTIRVRLFADKAPMTVQNFVNLAEGTREFIDPRDGQKRKAPYFNGVIFHRCIKDFMVQGGDPTGTGRGGPGYKFGDECHPSLGFDRPGLLAMANAGPGTNGSQFFITEAATAWLNGKHTIFGEVADAESLALVKQMSRLPQDRANRPTTDIVIKSVTIQRT